MKSVFRKRFKPKTRKLNFRSDGYGYFLVQLTDSDRAPVLVPFDLEVGVSDRLQLALKVCVLALSHAPQTLGLGDEAGLHSDHLVHLLCAPVAARVLEVLDLLQASRVLCVHDQVFLG